MWSANGVEHRLMVDNPIPVNSDANGQVETAVDDKDDFSGSNASEKAVEVLDSCEQAMTVFLRLPAPLKSSPLTIL